MSVDRWLDKEMYTQLTLEQQAFELCRFTYTRFFLFFFFSIKTTVQQQPWFVESTDVEPQI